MTGTPRFEIAWFLGSILGAALLWGLFSSALRRKGAPLPLFVLFAAEALWYSGEALSILIERAMPGSPAIPWAGQVVRLGLSLLPSALLGTLLTFAAEAEAQVADRRRRTLLLLIFLPGLGAFFLGRSHPLPPEAVHAFSLYAILTLTLSALLCLRLMRRSEMEVHRRFYRLTALSRRSVQPWAGGSATHRTGSRMGIGPPPTPGYR
ncbi:MAG: hypothetical protein EXS64_11040 [Candidatus Latescibacteria bacterium]|nr:hypothetical protein [Candidatus Latescibacterota bacterium]